MKKNKIISSFVFLLSAALLASCNNGTSTSSDNTDATSGGGDSTGTSEVTPATPKPERGTGALFNETEGFLSQDASLFEDNGVRYVTYVSNDTKDNLDTAFYVRKGVKTDGKWVYGDRTKVLTPSASGWDKRIAAPSVVKGEFKYKTTTYSYLMAYQGNDNNSNNDNNNIGFAVSNDMMSGWTKVGESASLTYDSDVFGDTIYGMGSPELVSLNKKGSVLLFYTWGEATLTATTVVKLDVNDLTTFKNPESKFQVAVKGLVDGGSAEPIFANAGFALSKDGTSLLTARDVYPLSGNKPGHSTTIEVASADKSILDDITKSWTSLKKITGTDTMDSSDDDSFGWDELYAASFVTDGYGYQLENGVYEVVYSSSDEEGTYEDTDYNFSSFVCEYKFTK